MAIDYLRLPERKTVRRPYGQWPHSAGSQIAKGFAGGAQQMSRNYFQDRAMDQRDRELARREAEDAELAQRRGATSNYINRREAGFQPTGRVDNWLMPDLQGSGSTAGADPGVVNKYETGRDRRAKSRREMEKELVEFTMEQAQQEAMWVLDAVNVSPAYDVLKQNLNTVAAQTPNMPEVTDEMLAKKGINAQTYAADRPKIQAQQQSIINVMKKKREKEEKEEKGPQGKLGTYEYLLKNGQLPEGTSYLDFLKMEKGATVGTEATDQVLQYGTPIKAGKDDPYNMPEGAIYKINPKTNETKIMISATPKTVQERDTKRRLEALPKIEELAGQDPNLAFRRGWRMTDDGKVFKELHTEAPVKLEPFPAGLGKRTGPKELRMLGEARDDAIELQELLKDPEVAEGLSKHWNRVLGTWKNSVLKYIAEHGYGAHSKAYLAITRMQRAASEERKAYLGTAVTEAELRTTLAWMASAGDNYEEMVLKNELMVKESDEHFRHFLKLYHNDYDMSSHYDTFGINRFESTEQGTGLKNMSDEDLLKALQ